MENDVIKKLDSDSPLSTTTTTTDETLGGEQVVDPMLAPPKTSHFVSTEVAEDPEVQQRWNLALPLLDKLAKAFEGDEDFDMLNKEGERIKSELGLKSVEVTPSGISASINPEGHFEISQIDKVLINQHKTSEPVLQAGWDSDKVDALAAWCKSMNQFNSYISNLTYEQWQVLAGDFSSGEELPNKVAGSWVAYQSAHTEIQTLSSFTGYKGSGGTTFNQGRDRSDWSGCYIATSEDQAHGYIGEAGQASGTASMWRITLKQALPLCKVTGGFIDNGDIPGDFKATVLKKILKIKLDQKLVPALGSASLAYLGPAGEDGEELVVPWSMVTDYINVQRIKEYSVNESYEITEERTL